MKNSRRIKEILVELAANDQLPLDMNELDTSLFSEFDVEDNVGGFTRNDVETHADEMGEHLTDQAIDSVMARMNRRFDASIGMNWDVIEDCIREELK